MLKLRPEDIQVMKDHAERDFPNECCGVIIGDHDDPSNNEVRPCANIQQELKEKDPERYSRDADTGYYLDPKDLMKAMKDASKRGLDIAGFYHSHPNHDAYWSEEDQRAAMWGGADEPSYPDACHVVISIRNGIAKEAAGFKWSHEEKMYKRYDIKL